MICPHCHRQRLYPAADRTSIGTCIACGDLYEPTLDPATASAEARRKSANLPHRYICPGCRDAFATAPQLTRHIAAQHAQRTQDSA